jgi:hypothetical protein
MKNIITRLSAILKSRHFFAVVMAFFIFESAWIAFSAIYPQAFDEDFHFGLIQVYSHYWLPFLSSQPPHANAFGAVARDPSYLYHYLMSFPYRLIALFVHGQTAQIILLRLINIGIFASGLVLFRRVLLRVGVSVSLTNISLLLFVLIPVAPQLAAQINYDNLLLPLIGWVCLLTFKMTDEIKRKQPSVRTLITLLSVCLLSSLVKYEFMPIFLGVIIFILLLAHQSYRRKIRLLSSQLWKNWLQQSWRLKVVLLSILIISTGMFVQRDGLNLIEYHTLSPDCATVLNVQDCSAYSVWDHDYTSHQLVVSSVTKVNSNPIDYVGQWIYWLWYRLFFAINGPASSFTNYPPLPLPSIAFVLIGVTGVIAILKWHRRIFDNSPYIVFLSIVTILYISALMADGYLKYHYTDVLELMNGRYLLPVLLLGAAVVGKAFSVALRRTPILKGGLAIIAIIFFMQGGGFLTFISRSDSSWDWQNSTVIKVNNAARRVADPVLINGKETYSTSIWYFN